MLSSSSRTWWCAWAEKVEESVGVWIWHRKTKILGCLLSTTPLKWLFAFSKASLFFVWRRAVPKNPSDLMQNMSRENIIGFMTGTSFLENTWRGVWLLSESPGFADSGFLQGVSWGCAKNHVPCDVGHLRGRNLKKWFGFETNPHKYTLPGALQYYSIKQVLNLRPCGGVGWALRCFTSHCGGGTRCWRSKAQQSPPRSASITRHCGWFLGVWILLQAHRVLPKRFGLVSLERWGIYWFLQVACSFTMFYSSLVSMGQRCQPTNSWCPRSLPDHPSFCLWSLWSASKAFTEDDPFKSDALQFVFILESHWTPKDVLGHWQTSLSLS